MGDIGAGLVSPTVSLQPGVGSLYTLTGGHVSSPLPHGHHDQGAQATACISHGPGTLWDGATFLTRWDLAPKELDGGLGMDLRNFVCYLRSCGLWHPPVAVLPPLLYPAGFWDAAAALG